MSRQGFIVGTAEDAHEAVEELKGQPGKDLVVLGSGELVRGVVIVNYDVNESACS